MQPLDDFRRNGEYRGPEGEDLRGPAGLKMGEKGRPVGRNFMGTHFAFSPARWQINREGAAERQIIFQPQRFLSDSRAIRKVKSGLSFFEKNVIFFLSSPDACARIPLDVFVALHPVCEKLTTGRFDEGKLPT